MANTFTGTAVGRHQRKADGLWDLNALGLGVRRDNHYVLVDGLYVPMCRLDPPATNRLLNSANPQTQTPPNHPAGTYCHWVEGAGSCTLGGGPTGTATQGAPVVFTLGVSTAVSFTVTPPLTVFQCEAGKTPTSFISTGAGIVTRAAERLAIDLPRLAVEDMTFYAKLREVGDSGVSSQRIFHFGPVTGPVAGPYWSGINAGTTNNFVGRLHDGAVQQNTNPSIGSILFTDVVELRAWINVAEGKHHMTVTRNGGAESASSDSPAFTMPGSFAAALLNIGGMDISVGVAMTIEGLALAYGVQNLATMRAGALPASAFGRAMPGLLKPSFGFGAFT